MFVGRCVVMVLVSLMYDNGDDFFVLLLIRIVILCLVVSVVIVMLVNVLCENGFLLMSLLNGLYVVLVCV